MTVPHIHGLAYDANRDALLVPAHARLVLYQDGEWRLPDIPQHDYMGFAITDDGFYSSGHPAPNADLENPLGLVKSTDGGRTVTSLAFSGESDFHTMAAGLKSHAVYVYNPTANSALSPGLHYTLDDGKSWKRSGAEGVTGQLIQMAVHPTEPGMVALATDEGLHLSSDYGDSFERLDLPTPATAVSFTPDGNQLVTGFKTVSHFELATGEVSEMETPDVGEEDAIAFIAVHPAGEALAYATFAGDIHRSEDGGVTWHQIADGGKLLP